MRPSELPRVAPSRSGLASCAGLGVLGVAFAVRPAFGQAYKFYDNGEYALIALPNAGTLEPPIAVTLNGQSVNNPATPGGDVFEVIELWDRVPGTSSYPLTLADIIASNYTRPLVQKPAPGGGGGGGGIGTSVIVGPSFRPAGQSLDLIPDMQSAAITILGGGNTGNRFTIQTTGTYGGKASFVGTRAVPDPLVGVPPLASKTSIVCAYTFVALQTISLPTDPKGKGFDAFRFFMLSSMLGSLNLGQYDANVLVTENAAGQRKAVALSDQPRGVHLFAAPQATSIGRGVALFKDKQATWNPESPSVEIRIDALNVKTPGGPPGGVTPLVGVQGYLASSTNPNDDSLNVWLEWLDAPATIIAGTTITAEFRIVATHPTDRGDLNHDGVFTCEDFSLFDALALVPPLTPTSPVFNAYADLNKNQVIDDADRALLVGLLGGLPADCDKDGVLAIDDFICFQTLFATGDPYADCDADGQLLIDDFICFQTYFAIGC
jgi:hypothetical protein